MENQELISRYIIGDMSSEEIKSFEERLSSDKAFKKEYLLQLAIVRGICKEQEQDDIEFGHALKELSNEDLKNTICKKPKGAVLKPFIPTRFWIGWAASIALVIGLGASWVITTNNHADNRVCDAVYSVNAQSLSLISAGEDEGVDINFMTATDSQLETVLPTIQRKYEQATDAQDELAYGKALALVQVKLHHRKEALKILTELVNKYNTSVDLQIKAQVEELNQIIIALQ